MREQRNFLPQVRTDEQNSLQTLDLGNGQSQTWVESLLLLCAEIELPQAMVNVVAADSARNARKPETAPRPSPTGREKPGRCATMRCYRTAQPFRRRGERDFPFDDLQLAIDTRIGCVTRSGEYIPSNPKRSRSAIHVSLIASFSRGTTRISRPAAHARKYSCRRHHAAR